MKTIKSGSQNKKIIHSLHHIPSLKDTISRLFTDGRIDSKQKNHIDAHLEEWVTDSKYILFNLGVHLGIGLVRFTALPFPIPIGSTLRPLWVMANRMYCNLKWDMHRKSIHSLLVLLFSIIPFLGYFAYTIPLKKKSEYLTYLYAEHISYMVYNQTFEERLTKAPKFIREIGYALLVPKECKNENNKP